MQSYDWLHIRVVSCRECLCLCLCYVREGVKIVKRSSFFYSLSLSYSLSLCYYFISFSRLFMHSSHNHSISYHVSRIKAPVQIPIRLNRHEMREKQDALITKKGKLKRKKPCCGGRDGTWHGARVRIEVGRKKRGRVLTTQHAQAQDRTGEVRSGDTKRCDVV